MRIFSNGITSSYSLWGKVIKRKYGTFQLIRWVKNGFLSPSPQIVKTKLLKHSGILGAPWLETGTYLGDTARTLARLRVPITTIEPSEKLFNFSKKRLNKFVNVNSLMGSSEELFMNSLTQLKPRVNIWLDGHYSGDVTFKNEIDTPIRYELKCIAENLEQFSEVMLFIDDARCFYHNTDDNKSYPTLDYLIEWARQNKCTWRIEQDIFIVKWVR